MTTLSNASLEPMWLVATHLYVPLSLSLAWAMSSFPSFVVSAPGGRLALPARLHSSWMGWEPWARHCTRRASPGWSLTWSGRQVAYGGAAWKEKTKHSCHERRQRIWLYNIRVRHLRCRLTLHLHLRVCLTVAMHVGCITDVLSWILAPHVVQCQNAIDDCVFPWQRCSELGPGDFRRRGAWRDEREREDEVRAERRDIFTHTHTCVRTPYHWPGTPSWLYVPPPLSFPWCSLKPVVLLDPFQQRPQLWPLSSPHCF